MAPALWPRVGSILWLACLLPWAPAAVAAGKAPRGPAACPPPAVARPGPRREPGLRSWPRAPCAQLPPLPSPGTALRRGHGQLVAARPSPLNPHRSPQKSPRHSGSPRPSLPPPDGPCPGNRAPWPAHPSRYLGTSQPPGVGEDDAGRPRRCEVGPRATASQEAQPGCPRSSTFALRCRRIWRAFPRCVDFGKDAVLEPRRPVCHFLSGNDFQNGPRTWAFGSHFRVPRRASTFPTAHRQKATTNFSALFW